MTDEFIRFFNANYTFSKPYRSNQYGIKQNGSNKYVQPVDILKQYADLRSKIGQSVDVTLEDIQEFVASNMPSEEKEERVPCRQWIMNWLREHRNNWKFSNGWNLLHIHGNDEMLDLVAIAQSSPGAIAVNGAIISPAVSADGFAVTKIFEKIAYDPNFVDPCDRFLKGIYNYLKPEEDFEIWCTLWKHWGWICKRRMLGREPVWHIWLNLFGATGLGKTTLLKKLCSPMADYTSVTNISMLFDSTREIAKLSSYYVLIFDELAVNVEGEPGGNLTEDNKSTLKSILTADTLDVRVYGTQRQSKQKITFVPVSSANNHLYDIIFDPTSMRRFFEFHCTAEKPKNFDEINKYLEHSDVFWKGIDEDLDRGYWDPSSEVGERISKAQSQYYPTRTTTSMWIDACHVRPGTTSGTSSYKAYCLWCRETGNKQKTMQNFVRDIVHMLPEAVDSSGKVHLDFHDDDDDGPIYAQVQKRSEDEYEALGLGNEDVDNVA